MATTQSIMESKVAAMRQQTDTDLRLDKMEATLELIKSALVGNKTAVQNVASAPKQKYAPKALAIPTFDNEKVVNKVRISGTRNTKAGNGLMVNFASVEGKKNYFLFVKQDWADKLDFNKTYDVSEHISKNTGKTSHAIHIGRKATIYGSAN